MYIYNAVAALWIYIYIINNIEEICSVSWPLQSLSDQGTTKDINKRHYEGTRWTKDLNFGYLRPLINLFINLINLFERMILWSKISFDHLDRYSRLYTELGYNLCNILYNIHLWNSSVIKHTERRRGTGDLKAKPRQIDQQRKINEKLFHCRYF